MRLKGVASAIDYAYLNVIDILDPDNRTHTKLDIYIVEEIDNMAVNVELTKPEFIKQCVIIIMLDFTNPWLFKSELEKWTKFINELQQMAKLTISELNEMAAKRSTTAI